MNRKMLYGIFLFALLASCISSKSLLSDGSIENTNTSGQTRPTLVQFLQGILHNPEYLAMTDYQQLIVLEMIYSLLEYGFMQQKSKSKNQEKMAFVS